MQGSALDTSHDNGTFSGNLHEAVRELRDRAARAWTDEPVLAKTLERIRDYLEVLLSSPDLTTQKQAAARTLCLESLQAVDAAGLEAAFEIEADLRASLPELAGDDYVYMCLQREQQRLAQQRGDAGLDQLWTDRFPAIDLETLIKDFEVDTRKFGHPKSRGAAVGRLKDLYKSSHHELRRHRARAAQAGIYLKRFCRVLVVLLVVVALLYGGGAGAVHWIARGVAEGQWTMPAISPDFVTVVIAMLAGAVGGTLGLMLSFRDTRGRIRELLSARDLGFVQPAIGAAMALAVVLVVKSGLITIGSPATDEARLALCAALGFVAGFSEPVFLGVIDRLAGAIGREPAAASK